MSFLNDSRTVPVVSAVWFVLPHDSNDSIFYFIMSEKESHRLNPSKRLNDCGMTKFANTSGCGTERYLISVSESLA
ncbi:MAG: hypothetical protein Q4D81_05825, partial [Eubacteriales bacterium]|nr:hypothetical protein [Eubacteriales bacterium]